jgi:hypothetical protein
MNTSERPKQRKTNMIFVTCNVRGIYRVGSLTTVAREIRKHRLGLVEVQEVRWVGVAVNSKAIIIFTWTIWDRTLCRQGIRNTS